MSKPSYPLIGWNNAGKTSNLYKLSGLQVVGFIAPSTIVSTSITFNMVPSLEISGALNPLAVLDSSGAAVSFTTVASTAKYYGFSQDQIAKFTGVEIVQIAAGSTEPVNSAFQLVLIPRQY